jgi:hypothetical protein
MLVHNTAPISAISEADLVGFAVAQCEQFNPCPSAGIDELWQVRFGRGKAAAVVQPYCAVKKTDTVIGADNLAVGLPAHHLVTEGLPVKVRVLVESNQLAAKLCYFGAFWWFCLHNCDSAVGL